MPKIAAIQMCSSYIVDENLETASLLLKSAAAQGAKLAVLPEMFPIIGKQPNYKLSAKEPYGSGKIQHFLAEHAARLGMWIIGGAIPISCHNPNKITSTSIVFNDQGMAVARYDKMHLFDATLSETEAYKESDTGEQGSELVVVDTLVGKLGLSVCYDIRFPAFYTHLRNLGAEIITVPSAFPVKTGEAHWHLLTRSRAVENFCYVVAACQGGHHKSGRVTYGHSLIIEPWGNIIQEVIEPGNAVICAEIDLEHLHKIRAAIPVDKHQKIMPDLTRL